MKTILLRTAQVLMLFTASFATMTLVQVVYESFRCTLPAAVARANAVAPAPAGELVIRCRYVLFVGADSAQSLVMLALGHPAYPNADGTYTTPHLPEGLLCTYVP